MTAMMPQIQGQVTNACGTGATRCTARSPIRPLIRQLARD
jgi:hypothetical protein